MKPFLLLVLLFSGCTIQETTYRECYGDGYFACYDEFCYIQDYCDN